MRIRFFLFVLFIVMGATSARAERTGATCTYYFKGETHPDKDVEELINTGGTIDAVKVCSAGEQESYFTASKIVQLFDVAIFQTNSIFRNETGDGDVWDFFGNGKYAPDQTTYMCVAPSDCSRQDSSGYVPTKRITAGVFRELRKHWRTVLEAPERFDALFELVPPMKAKESLKAAIQNAQTLRWISVDFDSASSSVPFPLYRLELSGKGGNWVVLFDIFEGEPKIVGAGSLYY